MPLWHQGVGTKHAAAGVHLTALLTAPLQGTCRVIQDSEVGIRTTYGTFLDKVIAAAERAEAGAQAQVRSQLCQPLQVALQVASGLFLHVATLLFL